MNRTDLNKQDDADFKAVFDTKEGRRVFSALITYCGFYRTSYNGEQTHAMAFKEGARNVALKIISILDRIDDQAQQKLAQAHKERTITENE